MTKKICSDFLNDLNQQMIKEDRKIIMFLDNASTHPCDEYSNIKLAFFPPNTTSVLQPLDAGVIAATTTYKNGFN